LLLLVEIISHMHLLSPHTGNALTQLEFCQPLLDLKVPDMVVKSLLRMFLRFSLEYPKGSSLFHSLLKVYVLVDCAMAFGLHLVKFKQ